MVKQGEALPVEIYLVTFKISFVTIFGLLSMHFYRTQCRDVQIKM